MKLSQRYLALASLCFSTTVIASDFGIPFVNTSGLGVAYADWATAANDASTTYTNPAGLVKLTQREVTANAMGIMGTAKFEGNAVTPSFPFPAPIAQSGHAKSKIDAFLPSVYYAAPLFDRYTFGFGVTAPFGLGTNYGNHSLVRHAATRTEVAGIDITPSIGIKLTELASIGVGVDALHLAFSVNNMYGPPLSFPTDAELKNKLSGWGYGWHAGALFQVTPKTRAGFSYNSMITLKTFGASTVYAPFGNTFGTILQQTNSGLPARAQASIQHDFTNRWTGMFTAFYTNWETFRQLTMQHTMTPFGTSQSVTIPFNYHNCFDYAVGATFKATEKWLLRGGLQYMNTPSNNIDRGVADPIGSATIATLGARFNQSETLSYDIGIGHSFFKKMPIHYNNNITALNGHTSTQTTVIGGQINWKMG